MRVFVALLLPAILSTTVFADFDHAQSVGLEGMVIKWAESEAQTFMPFRKKKKRMKTSNKVKRHNKSMGKKFKRKNDDTLRR